MKKMMYFTLVLMFLLAPLSVALAEDEPPQPQIPADADQRVFLPVMMRQQSYTISGRITASNTALGSSTVPSETALAGVTLRDSLGRTAVTDAYGRFTINVREGDTVTPEKVGYYFYPTYINANSNQNNANFTGFSPSADATAPNAQVIPNPSFEVVPYYWNPISGNAAGYTPYYTNLNANTGVMSGFTGIRSGQYNFNESWSRWRTHEITIPTLATQADLNLFIWPQTAEIPFAATDAQAGGAAKPEPPAALIGMDTESPDVPTLGYDVQYVAVIDPITNEILPGGILYWQLRNDQAWLPIGPLSLLTFAGRTVKIEFGTVNDTDAYKSLAYFDDVTLDITEGAVTCTNILLNPDMEGAGGWVYNPQIVIPLISTDFFWSPTHSLKTGIAAADTWYYSTTEAYQPFTIPTTAIYARLRMLILPKSTSWWGWYSDLEAINLDPAKQVPLSPQETNQVDSQYAHIAGSAGGEGLYLLFKYFGVDSAYWIAKSYNLLPLRGQTLSVQFGVGNVTSSWSKQVLYTDDVYLDVCTPTP